MCLRVLGTQQTLIFSADPEVSNDKIQSTKLLLNNVPLVLARDIKKKSENFLTSPNLFGNVTQSKVCKQNFNEIFFRI